MIFIDMLTVNLKRAYDPQQPDDGYRVFVDKLWPRGLSHATFHYDEWDKRFAPSDRLREWFHADPDNRWNEFATRYGKELDDNAAFADFKSRMMKFGTVTLLFGSHDRVHNNAVVIRDRLLD